MTASDEIKQAADELMHAALCGSKTGRPDYIHVVENDKLYRWHQAMQALLFQSQHGIWQPFTTAPTDGTEVLVYREDAGVFTAVYTYPVEEEAPDFDQGCWFTVGGEDLTGDPPSHWMPLPAGPDGKPQQPQQVVPPGHAVVPVEVLRRLRYYVATAIEDGDYVAPADLAEIDAMLEGRPTNG